MDIHIYVGMFIWICNFTTPAVNETAASSIVRDIFFPQTYNDRA